jgi:hypothetical protein
MVITTKWFDSSDKIAAGNHNSSFIYKSINLEEMIPDGALESLDLAKAMPLAAVGVPLQPKKETFALMSRDGHLTIRYFFNFNPQDKQIKTSVRFIYEGEPVILRITTDEYLKAKKIFESGIKKKERL